MAPARNQGSDHESNRFCDSEFLSDHLNHLTLDFASKFPFFFQPIPREVTDQTQLTHHYAAFNSSGGQMHLMQILPVGNRFRQNIPWSDGHIDSKGQKSFCPMTVRLEPKWITDPSANLSYIGTYMDALLLNHSGKCFTTKLDNVGNGSPNAL